MKHASRIYLCIVFAVLYIPILTLMLFSFNNSESTANFTGFSFEWNIKLFSDETAFLALRNTLILAVSSSLLSTLIGTAAAEGIYRMRSKWMKAAVNSVTNVPMMNPDIVTGVSFMLFFAAVVGLLNIEDYDSIGFAAMLIAHTTFCLPYVILSVLPRINELGDTLTEAALDLGCTPVQAFFKVELPQLMPGIITGLIMAFTMSFDDFVISYFTCGHYQTLPIVIYNMTKKSVTPDTYALSTLIFIAIFALLIFYNMLQTKAEKKSAAAIKRFKGAAK